MAPSAVFEPVANIMPQEMTIEEIEENHRGFC